MTIWTTRREGAAGPAVHACYDSLAASWTLSGPQGADVSTCGPAGFDQIALAPGVLLRVDVADPDRILECVVELDGEPPAPPHPAALDVVEGLFGPEARVLVSSVPAEDVSCSVHLPGGCEDRRADAARRAHEGPAVPHRDGPVAAAVALGRKAARYERQDRFHLAASTWRECADAWRWVEDKERHGLALACASRAQARVGPARRFPRAALRPPARPRRRSAVVLAVIAALFAVGVGSTTVVPAWALCRGDHDIAGPVATQGPLHGEQVTVGAVWEGQEEANFAKALRQFEEQTGAEVRYDPIGHDIASEIGDRIKAGCAPDVVIVPQPGLLEDLAARGLIQPVESVVGRLVDENYAPAWRQLGTVEGSLYGVWYKAANKSLVWYNAPLFERLGLEPPRTWDDMLHVADVLAQAGVAPFSIGGADGWTLTDWFENVYLQTSPELYDALARHDIPWTDPSVKKALRIVAQVFGRPDWLAGGPQAALATSFERSVAQVYEHPPKAAMVFAGDYAPTFAGPGAVVGRDVKSFDFPPIADTEPGHAVVAFGGDVAGLVRRSPGADRLLQFLASPEAAEPWARAGGFSSPNRKVPLDTYTDDSTRRPAEALAHGSVLGYDLSDLQPPAFGSNRNQGMWKTFQEFLRNPYDVDAVAQSLERQRAQAPVVESPAAHRPWWDTARQLALAGCLLALVALAVNATLVPRLAAGRRRRRSASAPA